MTRITVLGGTGYAGRNIVRVAAERGHSVTAYSRRAPESPIVGVEYRTGDVQDASVIRAAVADTDVVVSTLSPRGELEGTGKLRAIEQQIAAEAERAGVRFGVVGGAGSLVVAEGGPRVADTPDFPDAIKPEAAELAAVLEDLLASSTELDWFYVSPAGGFGEWAPGEATGTYRIGGDVLLVDESGESQISGADFADAFVTEIERPEHRRQRFTVAY
ncbi:NAD(P)H-binding protein [Leucobacter tardus]|uniref:NAD(P)H-binding protein n=1 Tax=Leucobacter tardus TaxID=501483 RepID=A0A939TMJ8_9MICO|nr:NAD(P)H-binding protein [Leucobacter tardus]MBO2989249.1 NAD(P)H-binding protein [Leucobacter tardus]